LFPRFSGFPSGSGPRRGSSARADKAARFSRGNPAGSERLRLARVRRRSLARKLPAPHSVADLPIDSQLTSLTGESQRQAALDIVRAAAMDCRDCPLWETGTQTVFGTGPATAQLMLIGEAPGAQEDQAGAPFVGPAGKLLQQALAEAGLARDGLYITNVVKHRPWVQSGKRQKNRPPKQSEINACRQWRLREIAIVQPLVIGCLGAHAAREILGKDFRLTEQRGKWHRSEAAPHVMATLHPSFILIQPAESYDRVRQTFFADIKAIAERYLGLAAGR
jgi:uracil-DNA glycosylase